MCQDCVEGILAGGLALAVIITYGITVFINARNKRVDDG